MQVLSDSEEELVRELSGANPQTFSKNLFQACIISDDTYDHFTSIDCDRVDPKIQIRYLLRLLHVDINNNGNSDTVWDRLLELLDALGISMILKNRLERQISENNLNKEETEESVVARVNSHEGSSIDSNVCDNVNLTLCAGDVNLLTELLIEVSHKWEEIAISLGLLEHEIAECRRPTNKLSLFQIISCWILKDATSSLEKLVQALNSKVVGAIRFAQELEEKVKVIKVQSINASKHEVFKQVNRHSKSSGVTISNMSERSVEVADNKTMLLYIQLSNNSESASFQWKKNGQLLTNSCIYSGVNSDILVISHARQGTEGEYTCCVSEQGKELRSNKITLTVVYTPAKKQLLDLYSVQNEVPVDSWPPVVTERFINLALIKSIKKRATDDFSVPGNADDIIAKNDEVEYKQLFGQYEAEELLLLEGHPGSGKTTLVHKIVKDWAKGEVLTSSKLVFLVILRVLNSKSIKTLADIFELFYSDKSVLEALTNDICTNNGEGMCFILDGLDEYQVESKESLITSKLLNRKYLSKATIIVTSRPIGTTRLSQDVSTTRIEVLGFSKQQRLKYIDKFPFTSHPESSLTSCTEARELKEYLVSNPNIFDMCYLPVHAAMICFLFDCDKKHILYTQTKIYEQFTLLMINRHLKRYSVETDVSSLKNLHGIHKKYFEDLCNLAFKMTIKSKQVISSQDLDLEFSQCGSQCDEYSLGLVTIYHTLHLTAHHQNYAFLHLTFQEFLAAYHLSNAMSTSQQLCVIKKNSKKQHMFMVWTFYVGLTKFQQGSKRLKHLLFGGNDTYTLIANALHFALESQQTIVCNDVVKLAQGSLDYHLNASTPTDLHATGYLVSTTTQTIKGLSLCKYRHQDDRINMLLDQIVKANLRELRILRIPFIISENGLNMLFSILKSNPGLRELSLNIKDNTPDGVGSLFDHIKPLTCLETFTLSYCSSNPSNIETLSSGIGHVRSGKIILTLVDVDTECAQSLGRRLRFHSTSKLHSLRLIKSSVGTEGALGISNGIRCHTALCNVNLAHCNIGQGVSHLAGGLHYLVNLESLNLSHNNINAEGAAHLATAFENLHNLEWLSLSHNDIGPAGMKDLAVGFAHLSKLKWLFISDNNIDLESATAVITSLKECHNLWTVIISGHGKNQGHEFVLEGLVSPEDTATITHLVSVVQSQKEKRILNLGFSEIQIPPKSIFWKAFYTVFLNTGYEYLFIPFY